MITLLLALEIMKFQDPAAGLILITLYLSCGFVCSAEFPKWPWDFEFSVTGPVSGYHCVQLMELVPQEYHWNDNHFCVRKNSAYVDIGMKWSNNGNLVFFQKLQKVMC